LKEGVGNTGFAIADKFQFFMGDNIPGRKAFNNSDSGRWNLGVEWLNDE
jgi:hypothetical protein